MPKRPNYAYVPVCAIYFLQNNAGMVVISIDCLLLKIV